MDRSGVNVPYRARPEGLTMLHSAEKVFNLRSLNWWGMRSPRRRLKCRFVEAVCEFRRGGAQRRALNGGSWKAAWALPGVGDRATLAVPGRGQHARRQRKVQQPLRVLALAITGRPAQSSGA